MMKSKAKPSAKVTPSGSLEVSRAPRLTPIRQQVFNIMARANKALGAYDILAEMQKTKPGFTPVTVYRTLEFLLEHGLIHRIESSNAFIVCEHPGEAHRSQLLICDQCGTVKEIEASVISEQLDKKAQRAGFKEIRQTLETHGLCRDCSA
jgi:Fur family zinc uptake transcriptional regulator